MLRKSLNVLLIAILVPVFIATMLVWFLSSVVEKCAWELAAWLNLRSLGIPDMSSH